MTHPLGQRASLLISTMACCLFPHHAIGFLFLCLLTDTPAGYHTVSQILIEHLLMNKSSAKDKMKCWSLCLPIVLWAGSEIACASPENGSSFSFFLSL